MDSQKLERFFKNECTPAEEQEVLEWFRNEELNAHQEQELAKMWEQETSQPTNDHNPTEILARIKASMHQNYPEMRVAGSEINKETEKLAGKIEWKKWYKMAAAILLPICLLTVVVHYYISERNAAQMVIAETLPGVRKTISLEDGSTITLNGSSKVVYRQHFPDDAREITLTGEAFFEVAKDKSRPFIVKTGPIATQALGTSFNINYRNNAPYIVVALATGVVRIDQEINQNKTELTKLRPNQQLIYDKKTARFELQPYDARVILGWRRGILFFNQASLTEVVSRLENWYGIPIELAGKVPEKTAEWNYTGEYNNQALEDVLTGISFVKDFTFEKKENKIVIHFN
ncbi:FecR family protein [Adhaeribacter swui]|nr:FecR family protein [Adhaeribacter swui]